MAWHYNILGPMSHGQKLVHYIGNRMPFGMIPVCGGEGFGTVKRKAFGHVLSESYEAAFIVIIKVVPLNCALNCWITVSYSSTTDFLREMVVMLSPSLF
jgi:hypothetical protein